MTTTKTTISMTEGRKRFFDIADEVQKPNNVYTLTADGKPKVVIISAEEYESLIETLDIMQECPDILDRVAESDKAFKTGTYKNWTTFDDIKRSWGIGLAVAENKRKKYAVQNKTRKPSKKRA